jgi:hypothetical protein
MVLKKPYGEQMKQLDYLLWEFLMNIIPPYDLSEEYYKVETEYLQDELSKKNITGIDKINEKIGDRIFLWKGDITTLQTNAISRSLFGSQEPGLSTADGTASSSLGRSGNRCFYPDGKSLYTICGGAQILLGLSPINNSPR